METKKFVRLGFETMECKMMHDMFMQKGIKIFLKGLSKWIVYIAEEHGFIWKLWRYRNRFPFQK